MEKRDALMRRIEKKAGQRLDNELRALGEFIQQNPITSKLSLKEGNMILSYYFERESEDSPFENFSESVEKRLIEIIEEETNELLRKLDLVDDYMKNDSGGKNAKKTL